VLIFGVAPEFFSPAATKINCFFTFQKSAGNRRRRNP